MSSKSSPPTHNVFTDANVESYRSHPDVDRALKSHILLNKREFMNWMDVPLLKPLTKITSSRVEHRAKTEEEMLDKKNGVLQLMAFEICKGIVKDYSLATMDQLINDMDEYDVVVAVANDYKTVDENGATKTVTRRKISKIVGFLITEKGECKKMPNAVSVNLICVRPNTISGGLLLGAYLYCIKNSRFDKKGILELARGYLNVAGFMSYSKMGFVKDVRLFGPRCFPDYRNLPMSVDLRTVSNEDIVGRAAGKTRCSLSAIEDESGIYNLGKPAPTELLIINNLLHKAEINYDNLANDVTNFGNPDYDNSLFKNEYDAIVLLIQNFHTMSSNTNLQYNLNKISKKKFIRYIEDSKNAMIEKMKSPKKKSSSNSRRATSSKGGSRNRGTRKL
jgi:hypothetical protein